MRDEKSDEIERITRVVLAVLDANRSDQPKDKPFPGRLRDFFLTNWQLTALLLSAFVLVGAIFIYDASPGYYFKQLAINDRALDAKFREEEYNRKIAKMYFSAGLNALDQGRYADADKHFSSVLALDKHNLEVWQKKLLSETVVNRDYEANVFEEIISNFFPNVGLGISDPHALAALGDLMFETWHADEARSYYRRAIQLRPQLAHAHAGLAAIAFEQGDFAAAAQAMQKAYELAPTHPDYITNLAAALLYAGRPREALGHYQEIFKIDQEKLSPYLECALAFRMQGDFGRSLSTIEYTLDFFDEALELDRNKADWFVVVNGSRYYLTTADEKRAYAYRTAELSAYLAGDLAAHERLNEWADGLGPAVPQAVRSAIFAEVAELHERQPALSSALDAYLRESGFVQ